jgi:hypothetical protein
MSSSSIRTLLLASGLVAGSAVVAFALGGCVVEAGEESQESTDEVIDQEELDLSGEEATEEEGIPAKPVLQGDIEAEPDPEPWHIDEAPAPTPGGGSEKDSDRDGHEDPER